MSPEQHFSHTIVSPAERTYLCLAFCPSFDDEIDNDSSSSFLLPIMDVIGEHRFNIKMSKLKVKINI